MATLSIVWAKFPDLSSGQVIKLSYLLPPQILLISLALSLNKEQLKPYIHLFPYGLIIGSVYLCFELLSGGVIFNLIRSIPIDAAINPAEFNRASVGIILYFFSAVAILTIHLKKSLAFIIMLIPTIAILLVSDSQSALLAFIAGFIFLFLFPYQSKKAWLGLKVIILTLMLISPFVMSYIYENFAETIQSIPLMARGYAGARLELWDYISRYALQEPLHGYGIRATRLITDFDSKLVFDIVNTVLHPHNFVLQIWIEFGLIGILIGMFLIERGISLIQYKFSMAQQKILLPTMMAALGPCATAYGMWQGWWIALLFHVAAMSLIACKFVEGGEKSNNVP